MIRIIDGRNRFFYKFTFSGRRILILYVYIFKLTPTHSYLKCNFYFPPMSIFIIRCFFGLSVSHNFEKKAERCNSLEHLLHPRAVLWVSWSGEGEGGSVPSRGGWRRVGKVWACSLGRRIRKVASSLWNLGWFLEVQFPYGQLFWLVCLSVIPQRSGS